MNEPFCGWIAMIIQLGGFVTVFWEQREREVDTLCSAEVPKLSGCKLAAGVGPYTSDIKEFV